MGESDMLISIRKLALLLLVPTCMAFFCGCRAESENYRTSNSNQIILRLAETQAAGTPSAIGVRAFARLVEEKTAGRIRVKVYYSGQLGEETNVLEQVQFGGVDFARVSLASLGHHSSAVRMVTLPYLITNSDQMRRIAEGKINAEIKEDLLKEKIVCLTWFDGGARVFYNTRREIRGVDDYHGLKISIQRSSHMVELYNYMGAFVVPISPHEQYRALQSGLIDGVDDSMANYYIHRHYEVAKHLLYDSQSRIPEVVVASRVTMMQLPRQDQEIIVWAAHESMKIQAQAWAEMEKDLFGKLREMGVLIHYVDALSMETLLSKAQPLYNNFRATDVEALIHY